MFTGIIEAVAEVAAIEQTGDLTRLQIAVGDLASGLALGASVAVNGACLTITAIREGTLRFEAVRETLERTALGDLRVGSRVNLERALRPDGRLDGHMVQGHVDATGRVEALEQQGDDVRFAVGCSAEFAEQLVPKGSVAIDGVSLTVVNVSPDAFDVALIPYTLRETTLCERRVGDAVNLEADVLGKYVLRYLERLGIRQEFGKS